MKDGSFEQELGNIEFEEDFEIQKTPLPSQVPAALNFKDFPETLTRSGAIEAVISQNDDLMSRLSVALRRISQLEDQIANTDNENKNILSKYESLQDQVLVFKEKARLLSERKNSEDFDVQSLKEQLQVMEIRYSELYQSLQTKESKWLSETAKIRSQNKHLTRFKFRLGRVARSLQSRHSDLLKSQTELSHKAANKESLYETVKNHLLEATEHIQKQRAEFDTEKRELNETIEVLNSKLRKLEAENTQIDQLADAKVKLENELVLKERQFEAYQLKTGAELTDLQSSMARYRSEAKELALKLDTQNSEISEKKSLVTELNKENFQLKEQVENLQALWKEQQRKLEKHLDKNSSLQKLNQELSTTINQYRRDLRDTRERLDALQIDNSEVRHQDSKSPELLEKIDQALGNLL